LFILLIILKKIIHFQLFNYYEITNKNATKKEVIHLTISNWNLISFDSILLNSLLSYFVCSTIIIIVLKGFFLLFQIYPSLKRKYTRKERIQLKLRNNSNF
jgi:hypothetical protein